MQQYFAREPESPSAPIEFEYRFREQSFRFKTDSGVFSKGEMDFGSELLLRSIEYLQGSVLDLGCGYGAIGIILQACFPVAVTMTDVNLRALSLAKENAVANRVTPNVLESDGFSAIMDRRFDAIVTNPPIRAGKQVICRLFREAREHLNDAGSLWLVIRKQQGAESAQRYLEGLFEQVMLTERKKGFWILRCIK